MQMVQARICAEEAEEWAHLYFFKAVYAPSVSVRRGLMTVAYTNSAADSQCRLPIHFFLHLLTRIKFFFILLQAFRTAKNQTKSQAGGDA
jgi:hypothetical protein